MDKRSSSRLLAVVFLSALVGVTGKVYAEGQLTPVPPNQLLSALPKTATDWKIKTSTGETRYSSGLMSRAVREFEYTPADAGALGQGAVCKLTLTDTAGNTSRLGKFRDFKEGSGPGYKMIRVKSYPAIVRERPGYGTTVSLLVDQRFTLDILLKGLPLDQAGKWIEATNLQALASVPDAPMTEKLQIIEMVSIDELNPENNRTYPLTMSDKEQIAAGLENLEDMVDEPDRDDTIRKDRASGGGDDDGDSGE